VANVTDAGVVTGRTLDWWTEMARVIARDGDVAWAQSVLNDALAKIVGTTQAAHAVRTGSAVSRRNP
jgi:hypothetical protein